MININILSQTKELLITGENIQMLKLMFRPYDDVFEIYATVKDQKEDQSLGKYNCKENGIKAFEKLVTATCYRSPDNIYHMSPGIE